MNLRIASGPETGGFGSAPSSARLIASANSGDRPLYGARCDGVSLSIVISFGLGRCIDTDEVELREAVVPRPQPLHLGTLEVCTPEGFTERVNGLSATLPLQPALAVSPLEV